MSRFVTHARHVLPGVLLAAALAGSVWLPPAGAAEGLPPGDYPSWEDVQRAKLTEAGTAAEIGRITGLLDGLQAQSEALGTAAVVSAAESAAADAVLAASTARVGALAEQAGQANAELVRHNRDIGALAVQSYKTGGTNMGFFVALDAIENNNVHGLNLVQLVGGKTAGLVDKAAAAGRITASLADQEKTARAERERLAGEAAEKLAAARSAQEAMARQLAEEQQRSEELTGQLASLKGTTAAVEAEFRRGQAALATYQAAQDAKRAAAEEDVRRRAAAAAAAAKVQPSAAPAPARPAPAQPAPPNPPAGNPAPANPAPPAPAPPPAAPPSPPAVVVPSAPAGAVNDPAGAKSYASGRLGAYGWGSDQFLCLAQLWTKESNWLTTATNPYSGAYGIPQALPPGKYSSAGSDWLTSYRTQIEWGLGYIRERYGSPCSAWNHSVAKNWY